MTRCDTASVVVSSRASFQGMSLYQMACGAYGHYLGNKDICIPRNVNFIDIGWFSFLLYKSYVQNYNVLQFGARCSSVVRVFAHSAMGRRINASRWTH